MNPTGTQHPLDNDEIKQKTMLSVKLTCKYFPIVDYHHKGQRSYGIKTIEVLKRTSVNRHSKNIFICPPSQRCFSPLNILRQGWPNTSGNWLRNVWTLCFLLSCLTKTNEPRCFQNSRRYSISLNKHLALDGGMGVFKWLSQTYAYFTTFSTLVGEIGIRTLPRKAEWIFL